MNKEHLCEREYDFSLVLTGANELTTAVEDAIFEAGDVELRAGVRLQAHFPPVHTIHASMPCHRAA